MRKRNLAKVAFLLAVAIFFLCFVSADYVRTNPAYSDSSFAGSFGFESTGIPKEACQTGQDFVVQVAPFGCTPAVVRSDLLEEGDVPVFCQLAATKVNPLVDVQAIEDVSFKGNSPEGVRAVGFQPSRAALGGGDENLNSPVLNSIGYAIIVLKQQENESAMPDFITGNMTATLKYNLKNTFGIGKVSFYLPQMSLQEWEDNKNRYSFWSGKSSGANYIRAENVDSDGATIEIYDGVRRLQSLKLNEGQTSAKLYLPGFDCLAGFDVTLNSLNVPDTRARLNINGEVVEAAERETFLGGRCSVTGIDQRGIVEQVGIKCTGEDSFNLRIVPKVDLKIDDETKDYEVGSFLYKYQEDADEKYVYLGYAGGDGNIKDAKKTSISILIAPKFMGDILSDSDLRTAEQITNAYKLNGKEKGKTAADWIKDPANLIAGSATNFYEWLFDGKSFNTIDYGETEKIGGANGKNIQYRGFSEGRDIELNPEIEDSYREAFDDFDLVKSAYGDQQFPLEIKWSDDKETIYEGSSEGEAALYEKIKLADMVGQKKTVADLCAEFESTYSDSKLSGEIDSFCKDKVKLSSQAISGHEVLIDGTVYDISFDGIYEPSFDEFGATIVIRDPTGVNVPVNMVKNQKVYLNRSDGSYVELVGLSENTATLQVIVDKGSVQDIRDKISGQRTLQLNSPDSFSSKYSFTLTNVNLKKQARVTINPSIDYTKSDAPFEFRIGIEKRGLKLSPEKAQERINALNETITEWTERNEKLGTLVKGMNTACLGTGLYLTLKNFLDNSGGKAIARQQVMRGKGGWYEICTQYVNDGTYRDVEKCLSAKSSEIDDSVDNYYNALQTQNERIKQLQSGYETTNFLGETVVKDDQFCKAYLESIRGDLKTNLNSKYKGNTATIQNDKVDIPTFVDGLSCDSVSIEDLRSLDLNSRIGGDANLDSMISQRLNGNVKSIYENSKELAERKTASEQYGVPVDFVSDENIRVVPITNDITFSQVKDKFTSSVFGPPTSASIPDDAYVRIVTDKSSGKKYLLKLDDERHVERTYLIDGSEIVMQGDVNPLNLDFKKYDANVYDNLYKSSLGEKGPVLRYYETEPYQGLPAVVPFDLDKGWYASMKQTLPVFGNIRAYDDSGRVNSLYVCNVGPNGIEENRGNDDICELINLGTGQPYNQFPGLTSAQASSLVSKAVSAVEQASRAHKAGASSVVINGKTLNVGKPAVDIPDLQCQDFMSPTDCKILFNVCDPVVCPSSRCDLGGAYPVSNVIQTGISGSLFLCSQNFVGFGGDVYIPVCLTGIHAGIEGWISMLQNHKDCLQEGLDTGKTTGICDEIYSLYQCEMIWREGVSVGKLVVPSVLKTLAGQNTRGGGEYAGIQSAWDTAGDSAAYFTQYYADDAYAAFKARSTENVGTELCKNYVAGTIPLGAGSFDALVEPASPSQFTGRFDEIPYTTATNPPISQYKVFYHIFAGNDQGAYYKVYLKGSSDSSFYQDTAFTKVVSSGYVEAGRYATDTVDFTAPSGYREMCIVVNNQEECGFQQVSTEFAVNYIADQYAAQQASAKNIRTEKECISGSSSLYSLLNPNIQEGVSNTVNPALYEAGITRICATDNPGLGTDINANSDGSRWVDVGYCGEENMRCWLDKQNVADIIKNLDTEEKVLSEKNADWQDLLINEKNYIKEGELKTALEDYYSKAGLTSADKISLIDGVMQKAFWNHHKGYLFLIRGKVYGRVAQTSYLEYLMNQINVPTPTGDENPLECQTNDECTSGDRCQINPPLVYGTCVPVITSSEEMLYGDVITLSCLGLSGLDVSQQREITSQLSFPIYSFDYGNLWSDVIDVFGGKNKFIYFSYYSGTWKWAPYGDAVSWVQSDPPVPFMEVSAGTTYQAPGPTVIKTDYDGTTPPSKYQQLIQSLVGKTYEEGVSLLINFAINNKEELYSDEAILSTEKTMQLPDKGAVWSFIDGKWDLNYNVFYEDDERSSTLSDLKEDNFLEGVKDIFLCANLYDQVSLARKNIDLVTSCEECGKTSSDGFCTQADCNAIGQRLGKNCVYHTELRSVGTPGTIMNDVVVGICEEKAGGTGTTSQFKSRTLEEFRSLVENTPSTILNPKCANYIEDVYDASLAFGITDPVILMSLMQQESSCNVTAQSSSSYGLMQIRADANGHCGEYGLPSDLSECQKILLSTPKLNIFVGAQVLADAYADYGGDSKWNAYYGLVSQKCTTSTYLAKYFSYKGSPWKIALRMYNGPGCVPGPNNANVNFVEDVLARFDKIVGGGESSQNLVSTNFQNSITLQQITSGSKTLTNGLVSKDLSLEEYKTDFSKKKFSWQYKGKSYSIDLDFYGKIYNLFQERDRLRDYDLFASDYYSASFIEEVAKRLSAYASSKGVPNSEIPYFVMAFVQYLSYNPDEISTGFNDYPKFPYETLYDQGGDCEDTAILASALLHSLGFDTALLQYSNHIALGVSCSPSATQVFYSSDGINYCYVETTAPDWGVGIVPSDYAGKSAVVRPIISRPSLSVSFTSAWTYDVNDMFVDLDIYVKNLGSKTANDVKLYAALQTTDVTKVWDKAESNRVSINAEDTYHYVVSDLHVPSGESFRIYAQAWGNGVVSDEAVSGWVYWK